MLIIDLPSVNFILKGLSSEYLLVTPDRSLVFAAMDCFMSAVRKATALHPGAPVVIDLSYVSIADFTTAYVRYQQQKIYNYSIQYINING